MPDQRPPFDMLRACFILLAGVIIAEMAMTLIGGFLCFWVNATTLRQVGACLPVVEVIREQWAEILTAVLALLLAAKSDKDQDK
jgi:hypothetical protein